MEPLTFKKTTNKLRESRLIKFALIGICIILFLKVLSLALSFYIIVNLNNKGFPGVSENTINMIIGSLNVKGTGAIATITTAIIARYGFRESTGNIAVGMGKEGGE